MVSTAILAPWLLPTFLPALTAPNAPARSLPPTPDEVMRACRHRGCIDTVRMQLYRAYLDSVDRNILLDAGFRPLKPNHRERDSGDPNRKTWLHHSGIAITVSRSGVSVTITPARIAFGRNDRISDTRHAGIPALIAYLTTDLLAGVLQREQERRATYEGRAPHLIGVWRLTSLHLTAHAWVRDEKEMDKMMRTLALARLGGQRHPPRLHHRMVGDKQLATGVQIGLALNGHRGDRMPIAYDKGWQEIASRSGVAMMRQCMGDPVPPGRLVRLEVQFNNPDGIAVVDKLLGPAEALDDPVGEPALPFVDPETQEIRSVLIGEERCHAVILDHLRELLAFGGTWPVMSERMTQDSHNRWRRADRIARSVHLDDVPARYRGIDIADRSMAFRMRTRRDVGLIAKFYPDDMPMMGVGLSRQIIMARQRAANLA